MPDEYGSPKQSDIVGRVERAVNAAMARIEPQFEAMRKAYPRPVGSKSIPPANEFAEYVGAVADSPEGWQVMINQWKSQGLTLDEVVKNASDYHARNEKRLLAIEPKLTEQMMLSANGNTLAPPTQMGADGTAAPETPY